MIYLLKMVIYQRVAILRPFRSSDRGTWVGQAMFCFQQHQALCLGLHNWRRFKLEKPESIFLLFFSRDIYRETTKKHDLEHLEHLWM